MNKECYNVIITQIILMVSNYHRW